MTKPHGPMAPDTFQDLIGWMHASQLRLPLPASVLCNCLHHGVLSHAKAVRDPVDGSTAIALTVQPVMPERLHRADQEGDRSPGKPRTRYWDPEAACVIGLALVNGGTLYVDDDGTDGHHGEGWHYPKLYRGGIPATRIFMAPQPGETVKVHVDRTHVFGHHDFRRRHFYTVPGAKRTVRGVPEFLDRAEAIFAKRNLVDKLTGPQRFHIEAGHYRQLLAEALALHLECNPSASPEQVAKWVAAKYPV